MPHQYIQNIFSSGELDPLLRARTDKEFYGAGARTMLNFCPAPQGGVTRRPGTRFLGNAMSGNGRLVPFVFSASQGRVLEFGDRVMRVWMPDGSYVLGSDGEPYQVATPYPLSALKDLRFAQSADVMYFAHRDYAPRKLSRYADNDWRWTQPTFEPKIDPPDIKYVFMTGTSESTVSDREYRYQIVSVSDEDGSESNPSAEKSCSGKLLTTSYHPKIMWEPVEGASYYKVYRYRGGVFGFIGRSTEMSEEVTGLTVNGVSAAALNLTMRTNSEEDTKFDICAGGYAWKTGGTLLVFNTTKKRWYSIGEPAEGYTGTFKYDTATAMAESLGSDEKAPVGTVEKEEADGTKTTTTYATTKETLFVFSDENIAADTADSPLVYENPFSKSRDYPGEVFFFQQRLGFVSTWNKPVTFWLSRTAEFEAFAAAVPPRDDDSIEVTLAATQAAVVAWAKPDRSCLAFGTESSEWVLQPSQGSVLTPKNCSFQPQGSVGSESIHAIGMTEGMVYVQRASKAVRAFAYQYSADKYVGQDLNVVARHLLKDVSIKAWAYQQEPYSILWCVTSDGKMIALTVMQDQGVAGWHRHETAGDWKDIVSIPGTPDDQVWMICVRNGVPMVERLEVFMRSDDVNEAFFLDSALTYDGAGAKVFNGLTHLAGKSVKVFADGGTIENLSVSEDGTLTLPRKVRHAVIGLPYTSTLVPSMAEVVNNQINSLMHNRTVLSARFRVLNSMTFEAGVDVLHPVIDRATTSGAFPVEPFYSEATDLDCTIGSGWKSDYPLTVQVSTPTPLTILAILLTVDVSSYSGRAR